MMHENMQAKMDAINHEERDRKRKLGSIPNAREWAYSLPENIVTTMTNPNLIVRNSYCATETTAAALRPYGLCDYASRHLSVFGCAVLKELIGEDR